MVPAPHEPALEAVRLGAVNYLTKPVDADRVLAAFGGPQPCVSAPLCLPVNPSHARARALKRQTRLRLRCDNFLRDFCVPLGYALGMSLVRSRVSMLVGVLLASTVVALSAHLKVEKTLPETGATVEAAPKELRVWFSQNPTLPISGLSLEGPNGKVELGKVAAGQTDGKADRSLMAEITGTLAPGKYTASWKTSGNDGHIMTGTFEFTLKADR